jgi:hypothetical protein
MSYVNDITLECLMNKKMYERLNLKNKKSTVERKERKLYRKRIIALTCEMLLNNTDDFQIENEDVVNSFRQYTKNCIQYFKATDENDHYQKELIPDTNKTDVDVDIDKEQPIHDLIVKEPIENNKEVTLTSSALDYIKIDTMKLNATMDIYQ